MVVSTFRRKGNDMQITDEAVGILHAIARTRGDLDFPVSDIAEVDDFAEIGVPLDVLLATLAAEAGCALPATCGQVCDMVHEVEGRRSHSY